MKKEIFLVVSGTSNNGYQLEAKITAYNEDEAYSLFCDYHENSAGIDFRIFPESIFKEKVVKLEVNDNDELVIINP